MHTFPKSGSATFGETSEYEQPQESSNRTSEFVYQSLTVEAMLLLLEKIKKTENNIEFLMGLGKNR